MRKKSLSWLLIAAMVLSLFTMMPMTALATDATVWTGETEDFSLLNPLEDNAVDNPYIIDTAAKLASLAQVVNAGNSYTGAYFELTTNLDLNELPWSPIGNPTNAFNGHFDGQDHVVDKLKITSGANYTGLFGCLGTNAVVESLVLTNVSVAGGVHVGALAGENYGHIQGCTVSGSVSGGFATGGLVGRNYNGLLEDCHSSVDVTGTGEGTGGLVGYAVRTLDQVAGVSVLRCSATGSVSGNNRTGGLIGTLQGGVCRESFTAGNVSGSYRYTGGLTGVIDAANGFTTHVSDCYSLTTVSAPDTQYVGGFTGANWYANVARCYAAGSVSAAGATTVGGLTGLFYDGAVTADSYYDTQVTGLSDNLGQGVPKTTAEMKDLDIFTNWDFPDVWTLSDDNNGYPALAWQGYEHGSLQTVADLIIEDAIAPINGEAPKTAVAETDEYTGTIAWAGDPTTFAPGTACTATITLTAKDGYTFDGVEANSFSVPSAATVSNAADSGVISATFKSPPDGYITDGNGIMAYRYVSNNFDIHGTYKGNWADTTCGSVGYGTIYIYNESAPINVAATGDAVDVGNGITMQVQPKFYGGGRFLRIVYTLHNSGSETATVDFGSHADTQIGGHDGAPITKSEDGRGFKMVNTSDYYPEFKGAQFNFFGNGTIGVTDVDTYWFGYWSSRRGNVFNQVETDSFSGDSGMAYSWKDKTLAPGQTRTFSVLIGIGDAESGDNVPIGVNFDSQGGSEVATIIIDMAGDTISAPIPPTRNGYTFGGWYTEPECTNQFNFAAPITATITLYAQWTQNAPPSGDSYPPPQYPVTDMNQGTQVGGQTRFSKKNAETGDTVIITVTPDKGYETGAPAVLDKGGNPVAVTDNGDGTFSFKMPSGGVTVNTKFSKIDYFDDVNEDDWFDEASWFCAAHGLMQGTGYRQFDGHMGTNRAMLVTVLYRLANSTDSLENIFSDVEEGKWYSEAVAWAAHNGIVQGYGNGRFGPDDALTREQLVAILYRYSVLMKYDVSKPNDLDSFTDTDVISEWALEAMKWAVGNGIVEGVGNGLVSPETGATRAQFAAMMQRFCTSFVK